MAAKNSPTELEADDGREGYFADLEKMEELVKSENTNKEVSRDWEEDVKDPMERLMVTKDKPCKERTAGSPYRGRGKRRPNYNHGRWNNKKKNWGKKEFDHCESLESRSLFSRRNFLQQFRASKPFSRGRGRGRWNPVNYYESDMESITDASSMSRNFRNYYESDMESIANASSVPFSSLPDQSSFPTSRNFHGRGGRNFCNYYESDMNSIARTSSMGGITSVSRQATSVSQCQLARSLADFSDYQATLLTLLDECQYDHKQVRLLVSRYPEVLEIDGEMVRLRPKVGLCSKHLDHEGCLALQTCQDLHICLQYLAGKCNDEGCIYGHTIHTNHNKPILNSFYLNTIPAKLLLDLFKSILVPSGSCAEKLEVCLGYSNGSCSDDKCEKLHLCLKLLAKSCSPEGGCKLNHKLSDDQITAILKSHGLSLNESPRDILTQVASSPLVKREIEALKTTLSVAPIDSKRQLTSKSEVSSNAKDSSSTDKAGSTDLSNKSMEGASGKSLKALPLKTRWSYETIGEVTIKEICYNSVEAFCPYEDTGCWRLHCNNHFHWQVRTSLSALKGRWINLTEEQALALEKEFSDPNIDKTSLPVLDPSTLKHSAKELLMVLNGRSKWEADFDNMLLKPAAGNKSSPLELRRLCTEWSSKNPTIPEACVFKWYFLDKNQKWIEYGNIDSTGEEKLRSDINSDNIEKTLRREGNDSVMQFSNQSFTYLLDLQNMIQINLDTNATRKVRRRPQPHLKDKKDPSPTASGSDLPITWEPMQPEERVRRVVLSPSSQEYQGLMTHLANNGGGGLNVLKIERVQNPFLWRAFQNKVQEMTSLYKDSSIVNVRQLFHGTNPDTVPKICQENFDWRLHGSNAGQSYGRGTYFSPLASTSHGYTRPDATGNRYMFVARVAVGTITTGNSSMTRPPMHPQYNVPYDTSANSTNNPSILVKYDKQEYFPEYIIVMT